VSKGDAVRWRGLGSSPEKIIFFCPQNDKFGCILMQFLTGRNLGQSVEVLGHGFFGSIAKQSLQKQSKNYPEIHGQPKGSHHRPLEYATTVNTNQPDLLNKYSVR